MAQLPDGVFRDLMTDELKARTGSTRVASPPVSATTTGSVSQRRGPPQRRSLVRHAIQLLLQQPSLAQAVAPPYAFAALDQPGVPLLVELLEVCTARPEANSASVLEHFSNRPDLPALQKLAATDLTGDVSSWRSDLLGAIERLITQMEDQRLDELTSAMAKTGLDADDKAELRRLHERKRQRGSGERH